MAKKKSTAKNPVEKPMMEKIAGKLGNLTGEIIVAKDHLVDMASGAINSVKETIQHITEKKAPAKKSIKAVAKKAVKKAIKKVEKKAAPAKKIIKKAVKKATAATKTVKKAAKATEKKLVKKAAPAKKAIKKVVKKVSGKK